MAGTVSGGASRAGRAAPGAAPAHERKVRDAPKDPFETISVPKGSFRTWAAIEEGI